MTTVQISADLRSAEDYVWAFSIGDRGKLTRTA